MTQKDYIRIARALLKGRHDALGEEPELDSQAVEFTIDTVAFFLADELQNDNPRFDREHFLAVVRGEKALNSKPARKKVEVK